MFLILKEKGNTPVYLKQVMSWRDSFSALTTVSHLSPPLSPDVNGNTDTDSSMDDDVRPDLACEGCDLVCESKEKLRTHQQVHTVVECNVCNKFILINNSSAHSKKCQGIPPPTQADCSRARGGARLSTRSRCQGTSRRRTLTDTSSRKRLAMLSQ